MCESCKNLGSIYCDECCRNINLADFYEATDSNDEAQKESLKKKAISEWMSLETSAKFQEAFNKAAVHFDLETPVAIKKSYYDKIINCLSGDIFLYYNPEKLAPLLFSGSNGRIVVAPLRKKY